MLCRLMSHQPRSSAPSDVPFHTIVPSFDRLLPTDARGQTIRIAKLTRSSIYSASRTYYSSWGTVQGE